MVRLASTRGKVLANCPFAITWPQPRAVAWSITSLITNGQRISAEVEDAGLDIPEMGVLAYPEAVSIGDPSAPLPATVMATKKVAA